MIVTNALPGIGWIECSIEKFLPQLTNIFRKLDADGNIIYARKKALDHEHPCQWKVRAFKSVIKKDIGEKYKHVIGLGDKPDDAAALRICCESLPGTVAKPVKFLENPTVDQLNQQHANIRKWMRRIVTCNDISDLRDGDPESGQ